MRWELLVLEDNFQHLNDRISRGKNRCSEWGNEFFRSFHAILNNIKENNNFQTLEIGLLNESLISFHSISPSWCYVFHRKPSFKAKKIKRTVRLFSPGLSLILACDWNTIVLCQNLETKYSNQKQMLLLLLAVLFTHWSSLRRERKNLFLLLTYDTWNLFDIF